MLNANILQVSLSAMSRNPTPGTKRAAFAALLDSLLLRGMGNPEKDEPWTNKRFSEIVHTSRRNPDDLYVVPNSVSNWRTGRALPNAITSIAHALFGESGSHEAERRAFVQAYQAARAEKALRPIKRASETRKGERWQPDEQQRLSRVVNAGADKGHESASDIQLELQSVVEDLSSELAERTEELRGSEIWGRLPGSAAIVSAAAKRGLASTGDAAAAYAASLQLGAFLEIDLRISHKRENLPPLPTDVSAKLRTLVQIASLWLRKYPIVEEMDRGADRKLHIDNTLLEAAAGFATISGDVGLITRKDAGEILDLVEATQRGEVYRDRAAGRVVDLMQSLLVATAYLRAAALCETAPAGYGLFSELFRRATEALGRGLACVSVFSRSLIMSADLSGALFAMAQDSEHWQPVHTRKDIIARGFALPGSRFSNGGTTNVDIDAAQLLQLRTSRLIDVTIEGKPGIDRRGFGDKDTLNYVDDVVKENRFALVSRASGPYHLNLASRSGDVVWAIKGSGSVQEEKLITPRTLLRPLRQQYLAISELMENCGDPGKLEKLAKQRRDTSSEGADMLLHSAQKVIVMDFWTARRLFAVICRI